MIKRLQMFLNKQRKNQGSFKLSSVEWLVEQKLTIYQI